MKGIGILLKKIKWYFQKTFKNIWQNFLTIMYLYKNAYSSLIINSRIIIHMSDERAWHPLQEN